MTTVTLPREGELNLAYETKVILALLARQIAKAETIAEAYGAVLMAANVEGMQLPELDEMVKKIEEEASRN
jgi:hypothetical protein